MTPDLSLSRPAFVILLVVLPFLWALMLRGRKYERSERKGYSERSTLHRVGRTGRYFLEPFFITFIPIVIVGALVGISLTFVEPKLSWDRVEAWLLLDTSLSMKACDGASENAPEKTSRLSAMRHFVRALRGHLDGASFALIPFAGDAVVSLLPTNEEEEFDYYVEHIDTAVTRKGTDLLQPLVVLGEEWEKSPPQKELVLVVFVSDGGKEAQQEPNLALLQEEVGRLLTMVPRPLFVGVGLGRESPVPIPIQRGLCPDAGPWEKDDATDPILKTAFYEPPLEAVRQAAGGPSYRLSRVNPGVIIEEIEESIRQTGLTPSVSLKRRHHDPARWLALLSLAGVICLAVILSR